MNYKIVTYPKFQKEFKRLAKKYPSLKSDFKKFCDDLLQNPDSGGVILGDGKRKFRMAIASKGKGKSHGARIITLDLLLSETETEIGLHYIYDKGELESISDKQIDEIISMNGVEV